MSELEDGAALLISFVGRRSWEGSKVFLLMCGEGRGSGFCRLNHTSTPRSTSITASTTFSRPFLFRTKLNSLSIFETNLLSPAHP